MLIGGAGAMGVAYLESLNENGEIQIDPDGTESSARSEAYQPTPDL